MNPLPSVGKCPAFSDNEPPDLCGLYAQCSNHRDTEVAFLPEKGGLVSDIVLNQSEHIICITAGHLKLSEWAYEYGPKYAISALGQRFNVLSNESLLRKAFSSGSLRNLLNGRQSSFLCYYIFFGGQGMTFTNDLETHAKLRKGFTQWVRKSGIQVFDRLIAHETKKLVGRLNRFEGKDCTPSDELHSFMSNVISILLCGKTINNTGKPDDVFWKLTRAASAVLNAKTGILGAFFLFLRFFPGRMREIYNQLKDSKAKITSNYFTSMKETFNPNESRGLVDAMLLSQAEDIKHGRKVDFTDEQIICIILETVGASMNTSVSTICSIIICLIHDQECQERLYQEILKVIGPDRDPTLDDRASMPYMEAIMYESLRYATPVPLSVPHLCTEDVDFEGYRIHKGDQLIMNLWHMHHDEAIWEDPYVFRPERFLDEQGNMICPSHKLRQSWMPFSIGRRQCAGEGIARSRISLLIISLVQRFRFLPPENGECISSDPRTYDVGIIIQPGDFKCRIQPR